MSVCVYVNKHGGGGRKKERVETLFDKHNVSRGCFHNIKTKKTMISIVFVDVWKFPNWKFGEFCFLWQFSKGAQALFHRFLDHEIFVKYFKNVIRGGKGNKT